ncbi:hypothetical protein OAB11_01190 [Verrucomicrobia bacterium]|nr:hypothetical protein [Verrucomicrobiota bacterium]
MKSIRLSLMTIHWMRVSLIICVSSKTAGESEWIRLPFPFLEKQSNQQGEVRHAETFDIWPA